MTKEARELARQYPVLTIIGPRQAGKTTLAKHAFPDHAYLNLEHPEEREFATTDPKELLRRHPDGVILDEIQRVPELLSYIQVEVDAEPRKGQFILTGSHQGALKQAVSQSLAGRTAVLTLWPLSLEEHPNRSDTLDAHLLHGTLPRVHADQQDPSKAYRSYLQTYVERDLNQLVRVRELASFQRFLKLCAGRVGQLLNVSSLAGDVGVSHGTIESWLSILESSFVIFRLQPYFENFNKRIVKSPKLYFVEIGLATHLLGIEEIEQVRRDPLRGALVENLMLAELFKARLNRGQEPNTYFLRDSNGAEIDAVLRRGHQLIGVEIKASSTFHTSFAKRLENFYRWVGDRVGGTFVLYGGEQNRRFGKHQLVGFREASQIALHGLSMGSEPQL